MTARWPVPLVRQSKSFSCGAACVLCALLYWNVWDGPERDLFQSLGTNPETGTEAPSMVRLMASFGLSAKYRSGHTRASLCKRVEAGNLAIVSMQAWPDLPISDWSKHYSDGHWCVVQGFTKGKIYLMDPSVHARYVAMSWPEFERRWHDVDARGQCVEGQAIMVLGSNPMKRFPLPPLEIRPGNASPQTEGDTAC